MYPQAGQAPAGLSRANRIGSATEVVTGR